MLWEKRQVQGGCEKTKVYSYLCVGWGEGGRRVLDRWDSSRPQNFNTEQSIKEISMLLNIQNQIPETKADSNNNRQIPFIRWKQEWQTVLRNHKIIKSILSYLGKFILMINVGSECFNKLHMYMALNFKTWINVKDSTHFFILYFWHVPMSLSWHYSFFYS